MTDCIVVKRANQCSERSSPSVLEVGPDGPLVVVCLFRVHERTRAYTGRGRTGRPLVFFLLHFFDSYAQKRQVHLAHAL